MFGIGLGGLFTGPVNAILAVGDDKLKQQGIKSALSAAYSAVITGLFEAGRKRQLGFGPALQAIARSIWLSLQPMEEAGLLALAVPKDLMSPDDLDKFECDYNQRLTGKVIRAG